MEPRIEKFVIEELELRIAPSGMPAPQAFCAGGAWHNPHMDGIRFIADPCTGLEHEPQAQL